MSNDILCEDCADRYSKLLRAQLEKTGEFNARSFQIARLAPGQTSRGDTKSDGQEVAQAVLEPIQKMQESEQALSESRVLGRQRRTTTLVGVFLLGIGMIALIAALVFASTISTFIGLGLTLWGMLSFFIQPSSYVKADLMNAAAISSLKTIDLMMVGMGYGEKGVYVPAKDLEKVAVFVPSEPFSYIPDESDIKDEMFLSNPHGLLVPPPGLALAALIQNKLGFKLKNCGVEALIEALPKVLVEDLEIAKDVEIEVDQNAVRFKLYDSIYSDFCSEVRETSRRCGLGCPMCSALASILAIATGKVVSYEEDKMSDDHKVTESVYRLIGGHRL